MFNHKQRSVTLGINIIYHLGANGKILASAWASLLNVGFMTLLINFSGLSKSLQILVVVVKNK